MKFGRIAALCICALLALLALAHLAVCGRSQDGFELELVQVLFRHGERTPQYHEIKLIPDANEKFAEPWGFAQLTNNGKMQEYNIGRMLRRLYDDFLGDSFRPKYLFAQSSGYDRTKASLHLVLASLYTPSDELLWNDNLKWLPIPIHSVPSRIDNLFFLNGCPRYRKLLSDLLDSPEIKKRVARYEDLYKYLKKFYPQIKFNIEQLFYLNNILTIQKTLNISAPIWYAPEVHERIIEAAKFHLDTLSYTPELIKLNGGAFARRILENMDVDNRTRDNPRRMYLYSGHEFTVYAFAKAHNITLPRSPAYGSAIIHEKLRDEEGKLYVQMKYWSGPSEELSPIKLTDCETICPIEKYMKIIEPFLPSDDDVLCLYENLKPTDIERILKVDVPSKLF